MNEVVQAKEILSNIIYATIATISKNNMPWNSPVFYTFDEKLNLYWSSHPESQHSRNITNNTKIFIVIYNSGVKEGEGIGLYIKGYAETVTDIREVQHAVELLGRRRGRPFTSINNFINGPQKIYKAVPEKLWLNDAKQDEEGNFIKDFRIEVPIPEVSKFLSM